MQPQEQPVPAQPVYYVPVQAVSAPPAAAVDPNEKPRWVVDLEYRTGGHSVGLAFIGLIAGANLVITIILFVMIHGALHPFGG